MGRRWAEVEEDTLELQSDCYRSSVVLALQEMGPIRARGLGIKSVYLFYIYFFLSFFCSQFLLCPNWSFSKRCIQNNGKDSGYLFIARSDSINIWTWVNMSFLFVYLFIYF